MNNMTRLKETIYICIVTLCLTGCGKDKVEYVDETQNIQATAGDASIEDIKTKLSVEDYWEEIVDLENGKKIEANITVPDTSGMKVVTATQKFYGPEDREQLLNAITDGNVYKYDYDFLPKGDIYPIMEEYRAALDVNEEAGAYEPGTVHYDNGGYYTVEYDDLEEEYEKLAEYEKD